MKTKTLDWFNDNFIENKEQIENLLEEMEKYHTISREQLLDGCKELNKFSNNKKSLKTYLKIFESMSDIGIGAQITGMKLREALLEAIANKIQNKKVQLSEEDSSNISFELATKRIRQAVEYAKYKAWNSEEGEEKAQSIVDDFHNGQYGSNSGIWVQVNEAVELMESL